MEDNGASSYHRFLKGDDENNRRKERMKKRIVIWLCVVVVSCVFVLNSVVSLASQVILSYSKEQQAMTNWCWVASARNAVKYSQYTQWTQPEAVIHVKGACVNQGGSKSETKQAAEYFSYGNISYSYSGAKTYSFLTGKIDNDRVNILGVSFYNSDGEETGGHMVTMHGYFSYGSYASMIWYYDPYPVPDHNSQSFEHECSFSQFQSGYCRGGLYNATVYATN